MAAYTVKVIGGADQLLLDIDVLEERARSIGFFPAARALNNAKNAIGWQLAGNIEKAAAAAVGGAGIRDGAARTQGTR